MNRVKISANFYLDEFISKGLYMSFKERSVIFLDINIVIIAQAIRDLSGCPITINNWWHGGERQYSGHRPFNCKIGGFYSQHKYGRAIDPIVHGMTPDQVYGLVKENWEMFMKLGLTTMEDLGHTPTWNHFDCRYSTKSELLIVKP